MAKKQPPEPTIPSKEEFLRFAEEKDFDLDLAARCYLWYRRRGWRFPTNGDPILPEHWLRLLEAWERNAKNWNPDRPPGDDQ